MKRKHENDQKLHHPNETRGQNTLVFEVPNELQAHKAGNAKYFQESENLEKGQILDGFVNEGHYCDGQRREKVHRKPASEVSPCHKLRIMNHYFGVVVNICGPEIERHVDEEKKIEEHVENLLRFFRRNGETHTDWHENGNINHCNRKSRS